MENDFILQRATPLLSLVMSASEAEDRWGLKTGTVRASCTRGKLKDHIGVRKSGNVWLVTVKAMEEVYGEPIK